MPYQASHIGALAELRVSHNVKICKSSEAERFADPVASGFLNVQEKLRGVTEPYPREKGQYAGSGVLCFGGKTIGPLVRRVEIRMPLRDEIRLTGNPEAARLGVRKQRW